jgi:site-specific DNA-methyltransferase (adenine-specific)
VPGPNASRSRAARSDAPAARIPTSTSSFGVSRRENHDASAFYERFTTPEISDDREVHPDKAIDAVFGHAAESMPEVPDKSVALVVTSPPYFAGKEYEQALGEGHVPGSYLEYLDMLTDVFAECARTLEPGGRIAVNVANLGRKPYRSLAADVTAILQDRLRLLLRGEIVWVKGRGASGSCAWGSFQRPGNPVLRDLSERIVVASKGRFDRALTQKQRRQLGLPHLASSTRDEFMEATTDVWEIPAESATRVGHPAPFPVELPERLIHLYTYYDDLVLDPFLGSGSTAVAAVRTGRHYVGYDTDPEYLERAEARIEAARAAVAPPEVVVGTARETGDPWRDGAAMRDLAIACLQDAGFTDIESKVRLAAGVDVSLRATDALGRAWHIELGGARTTARAGLRPVDVVTRVIATAALVREIEPKVPLLVLTTALPNRAGGTDAALRVMVGPDKPIAAVLDLRAPESIDRLRAFACDSYAALA